MRYLLDTNVCIEILRGRNLLLKARLASYRLEDFAISSVVWAELQCGVHLANQPNRELSKLNNAFEHWQRIPFDDVAAVAYGEIRAELQRTGLLIGGNDMLIAATALVCGLILVTHNTDEFLRVPGLIVEDWQI